MLRYSGRGGAGGNHGFAIPKDSMLFKIKKRNKKSLLKGEDERENGAFNPKKTHFAAVKIADVQDAPHGVTDSRWLALWGSTVGLAGAKKVRFALY